MIGEILIDLFLNVFRLLFGAFEVVNLPTQVISTLSTILVYGNWVVGLDIMVLFATCIVFWWGFYATAGLAVWVWDRLPLT